MSNDFHPDHNTPKAFLDEIYSRQLATIRNGSDLVFCVSYMDERQIRESIVDDVVAVTMWEKQKTGQKLHYDVVEMLKFVDADQHSRVIEQLTHPEIASLFNVTDGQYRIIDNPEVLKAAMDYAGVWYEGFTPPEGTEVLTINTGKVNEAIDTHGSLENLAKYLAAEVEMDMQTNAPSTTTHH